MSILADIARRWTDDMANINDFRRRRLAAAAGKPETESIWRTSRWVIGRWVAGITLAGLIMAYIIIRILGGVGVDILNRHFNPDATPHGFQKVDQETAENFWNFYETAVAETSVAESHDD